MSILQNDTVNDIENRQKYSLNFLNRIGKKKEKLIVGKCICELPKVVALKAIMHKNI